MIKLTFLNLLLLFSINSYSQLSALDGTNPLTEQEEDESKNYVHQGLFDEKVNELCNAQNTERNEGRSEDKQTEDFCNNEGAFRQGSFASKLEVMMPVVTKAYASFGPLTSKLGSGSQNGIKFYKKEGGSITQPQNNTTTTSTESNTSKDEKEAEYKTDICQYIPMATEVGAQALQMANNQTTATNYENEEADSQQAAAFYAMADMHKTKKTASTIQAAGWGTTSACYLTYVATGATVDFKMAAKIGASALIATFYGIKAKNHKEREEAFRLMATQLPNAGDCNPHTKTTCFCAHESSYSVDPTNYQKYCVPSGYTYSAKGPSTGCVNNQGKSDPSCTCKAKGTCMATSLATSGFKIGLNPMAVKSSLDGISYMDSGYANDNLLAQASKNSAMAFKALKAYKPQGKAPNLNKDQKDMAKALIANGIPTGLAMQMAGTPDSLSGDMLKNLKASLNSNSFSPYLKSNKKSSDRFKSGGSAKTLSKKAPIFNRARKSSGSGQSGTQIMDFAAEATREAEIEKDSSKGIFDIITNRYKVRAWSEFKDDILEKPPVTQ